MNLSGSPVDYINFFLAGVGMSFTPCVYPLIPVVVGYMGITQDTSRYKSFFLSFLYVTGVAITYSLLGLAATLTGKIFGLISSSPVTILLAGIYIIFFGFSMLDIFSIPMPRLVKPPTLKKHNFFSALLLGLISGLLVSPCTAPALGSILVYLAAKKNIAYGMTVLLSFAYGMGFVLILAGTFSGILSSLPKSGRWLVYIKRIGALIILGAGAYFIYTGIRRLYF